MKFAILIICLLLSNVCIAGAFIDIQDHDNVVHELAHVGAGVICVLGADAIMRLDKDYKKHPIENFIVETMGALVVTGVYEALTEKTLNDATPRLLAGLIGGLVISYRINF